MFGIRRGARRALAALCMAVINITVGLLVAVQGQYDSNAYRGLHWRNLGPFRGGRVNAVAGVIGQPDTFYFGSVGGGLWKTTNSGRTWMPVFDSQPIASIGAIGVSSS